MCLGHLGDNELVLAVDEGEESAVGTKSQRPQLDQGVERWVAIENDGLRIGGRKVGREGRGRKVSLKTMVSDPI